MSLTDDEKVAAIASSLGNSLKIIKALFPSLLGAGLQELSKDPRVFGEAVKTMQERLMEKNRDDEFFIDEGDRETGDYTLKDYRLHFTK